MKKINILKTEQLSGGSRCDFVANFTTFLGAGLLASSFIPINFALGVVLTGVGMLAIYGCKNSH